MGLSFARRLLSALADSSPAFTSTPTAASASKSGRLISALADSTPAFLYSSAGPDEYRWRKRVNRGPLLLPVGILFSVAAVVLGVISIGYIGDTITLQKPSKEFSVGRGEAGFLAPQNEASILAVSGPAGIEVWSANNGQKIRDIPTGVVSGPIAVAADGRLLAISTTSGVELWSMDTGRLVESLAVELSGNPSFGPDGNLIVPTRAGVGMWYPGNGAFRVDIPVQGVSGSVSVSSDGRLLAAPTPRGIELWSMGTGARVGVVPVSAAGKPSFSPDARLLIVPSADAVEIWDVQRLLSPAGAREARIHAIALPGQGVMGAGIEMHVAFSADSRLLAVAGVGGVEVWDLNTERIYRKIPIRFGEEANSDDGGIPSSGQYLPTLAFRVDGRTLVSYSPDGVVQYWPM